MEKKKKSKFNLQQKISAIMMAISIPFGGLPMLFSSSGGTGIPGDEYIIATEGDFISFAEEAGKPENNGKHWKLTSDFDIQTLTSSGVYDKNNGGWKPISEFNGTLDGDGHRITGLHIDRNDTELVGFFSKIGVSGTVKNVIIETNDSGVKGKEFVGILAGSSLGTIEECGAIGTVGGKSAVGGLVGSNAIEQGQFGKIKKTYAYAAVTGETSGDSVGGLAGRNFGEISDSCTFSTVTGNSKVGGFIGEVTTTKQIERNYAAGTVKGTSLTGGFIGSVSNLSYIQNCYYLPDTPARTGIGNSGISVNPGSIAALTIQEMTDKTSFSDFNFTSDWAIGGSNETFPYLTWMENMGNTGENDYSLNNIEWQFAGRDWANPVLDADGKVILSSFDREDTLAFRAAAPDKGQVRLPAAVKAGAYDNAHAVLYGISESGIIAPHIYPVEFSNTIPITGFQTSGEFRYKGDQHKPTFTIQTKVSKKPLAEKADYQIVYKNNIDAGEATVELQPNTTGTSEFSPKSLTFTIKQKAFTTENITVEDVPPHTYDGKDYTPTPKVTDKSLGVLTKDTHYTLTYSGNKEPGKGKVYVKGMGNYSDQQIVKEFEIVEAASNIKISVSAIAPQSYTGKAIEPKPTIYDTATQKILTAGTDYKLSYQNNTNIGIASLRVEPVETSGSTPSIAFDPVTVNFSIVQRQLNPQIISVGQIPIYTYAGRPVTPIPEIRDVELGTLLLVNRDYMLSYTDNNAAGIAYINLTGLGNYTGQMRLAFVINDPSGSRPVITTPPPTTTTTTADTEEIEPIDPDDVEPVEDDVEDISNGEEDPDLPDEVEDPDVSPVTDPPETTTTPSRTTDGPDVEVGDDNNNSGNQGNNGTDGQYPYNPNNPSTYVGLPVAGLLFGGGFIGFITGSKKKKR